ncbi:STAS domain-containing protein [Streptomyces sp. NPDC055056]
MCSGAWGGARPSRPRTVLRRRRFSTWGEVAFMDSSAISVLAAAHRDAAAAGGELRMAALTAPVARVGERLGLPSRPPFVQRRVPP